MTQQRRLQTQREKSRDLGMLDVPYLILTLLLVAVGLIMLFSASYARAYYLTGNSARYFTSQLVFAALGTVVMLLVSRVPYRWYEKCNWLILAAATVLLVLVLVIGTNSNGATRWINLGFTSLQPSEIAKFSLAVYLAAMLDKYQANARSVPVFLICVLPLAVFAVLLKLEPHFSAIIILCMLTGVLLFVGGANRKCLIVVAVLAAAALAALLLSGGYTSDRIMAWRAPERYASDEGYQILQSEYAIGSGGLLGLGFGKGRQKYLYLPEEHNDYIFAVVCEELGFIGAVAILLLFALLIIRGFWIAIHARDRFSMLLGVGLTALLAIQVILNVAVVTNLLPSTGISLPFFSSGGTALVMQLAECGIMLNISRSIGD